MSIFETISCSSQFNYKLYTQCSLIEKFIVKYCVHFHNGIVLNKDFDYKPYLADIIGYIKEMPPKTFLYFRWHIKEAVYRANMKIDFIKDYQYCGKNNENIDMFIIRLMLTYSENKAEHITKCLAINPIYTYYVLHVSLTDHEIAFNSTLSSDEYKMVRDWYNIDGIPFCPSAYIYWGV